jgi:holo-[acyl-carrier protein] synthase
MIKGIGCDIIEIERIAIAITRRGEHFVQRLFTPNEQPAPDSASEQYLASYYAGRFAGKEAVAKVFGTGFRGFDWQDIEILNDPLGKPYVTLSPALMERFDNPNILISISHSKTHACAFCIWQVV